MYNASLVNRADGRHSSRKMRERGDALEGHTEIPHKATTLGDNGTLASGKAALIADDDEFFRMALRVILTEKLGFAEVIESQSFGDAVEQLSNRSNICLALFDLSMPGMGSPASLRAVREGFRDLRTAVVSGSRRQSDILAALTSGVHGYIPKSVGAANITRALTLVMDGLIYVPLEVAEVDEDEDRAGSRSSLSSEVTPASLTPRQREVLELLVQGKSNKEIARTLALGEGTVKVHMSALLRRLSADSRSAAAAFGVKLLSQGTELWPNLGHAAGRASR